MVDYDSKGWLRVLLRVQGTVLPALAPRVLFTVLVSSVAVFFHDRHHLKMPPTVHTMLGVALGLLLVFRTNASYDRWWEGRKLLGTINNRGRDLARQSYTLLAPGPAVAEAQRLLALWHALLRQHLRRERDLNVLGALLDNYEQKQLEPVVTRPALVARWLGELYAREANAGRLSEHRLALIDQNLTALHDAWGGCERILRTPIPFAYAHHIKAFLALFVFTVPFALAEAMGHLTPIAAALVAYGMFGIEEIGVEIEDPFGYDPNDLPLDRMGETLAVDTKGLVSAEPLRALEPVAKGEGAAATAAE